MTRLAFGTLSVLILLAAASAGAEESCCDRDTSVKYGNKFGWAFHQSSTGCNLELELEDGASLKAAMEQIICKNYDTIIINGRQLTKPFVIHDDDLEATPLNTNVIYENMPPVEIDTDATSEKIKSLNLVNTPEFKFHPSLLDEADSITFDDVKISYNGDERVFKISHIPTGKPVVVNPRGDPRAEALRTGSTLTWRMPSVTEVVLMMVCAVELMAIVLLVLIVQSRTNVAKAVIRRESILRTETSTSLSSQCSRYSSDSQDSTDSTELLEIKHHEDTSCDSDALSIVIEEDEDVEEKK